MGEEDEDAAGVSLSAAFGVKSFPLLDAVLPYLRELDGQRWAR